MAFYNILLLKEKNGDEMAYKHVFRDILYNRCYKAFAPNGTFGCDLKNIIKREAPSGVKKKNRSIRL